MIGILFATQMEAAPFLEAVRKKESCQEDAENITRFDRHGTEFATAVVGMGKFLARQETKRFIERYQPHRIINAGIAGALIDTLEIGRVYRVSTAVDWPDAPNRTLPCAQTGFEHLQSARLVTSDKPVFDDELRRTLQAFGDLVDMEGAVIADTCLSMNIECIQLKCISDFASNSDREQLHRNLDVAARTLARALGSGLR